VILLLHIFYCFEDFCNHGKWWGKQGAKVFFRSGRIFFEEDDDCQSSSAR
jgi:hypothetical protein